MLATITHLFKKMLCHIINQPFLVHIVIIEKHIREVEEKDALRNWKNPIDGNYIMETFGIGPCKTVAVLKDAVKEAILDGVIGNNFDEAEAFVKQKAKEIGLV